MTIQIGKLRKWTPPGETKEVIYFSAIKGFNYPSLKELFDNVEKDLNKFVGEKEQVNLFYTVAHHLEGQRTFKSWQAQDIVPFDLDGIDLDRINEYPPVIAEACGFELDKCAIVHSGNGCHILVQVPRFSDNEFIKNAKLGYKQLVERIKLACDEAELPYTDKKGPCDSTAWDYARILRVPFTKNVKVNEDGSEKIKYCKLVQNNLTEQPWSVPNVAKVSKENFLAKGAFPQPDKKEILNECRFFKWLKDNPDEVHEPHAYAMLSIAGHFTDDGAAASELWGQFSSPSINSKNLDEFTEQALTASGPRTCQGINEVWGNCKECPHYQKVTSPILLKGDDFIGTEHMGFSTTHIRGNGSSSIKRHYEDLRKWYKLQTNYIHIPNRRSTLMEFNGKFFVEVSESHIKSIAQKQFLPLVEDDKIRTQFLNQVKAAPDSIKDDSFLHTHKENLINLNNGVLDLEKGELLEHNVDYGFTACMDYDYEPDAVCPNWDKFISAAMRGNNKLADLLEEMLAFTLSGMAYNKFQFYFLLIGKGFNGKSTFITLLQRMLGPGNYTAHPLEDLIDKQDARASLATSLANLVADSSAGALKGKDLTRLKSWTGNDAVTGRALYKDSISFVNKAKFIFGFNDYPEIKATSTGDIRRIKAIPFNADFKGADKDFFIKDLEKRLVEERPGILNKVIKAYDRLMKNGFSHCESLDAMKRDIRKNADSVYDFVTDFVEYKEGSKVFVEDIYRSYTNNDAYSAVDFMKQPRTFSKELRNVIATNDAMRGVIYKDINMGGSVKKGLYNARLIEDDTLVHKF